MGFLKFELTIYPQVIHPVRSRPAEGTATTASGRSASNGVHS